MYAIFSTLLLLLLSKGQKETFFFKWIIVICIPIIGWLLRSIWPKRWIKQDESFFANYLNEQSNDISTEILQARQHLEKQKELSIISVEEALIVNDYDTRRKVLIDILKQDAMQFIDVLKTAVVNDDSETSHYAVTAVIEVKRELTILLQKLAVQFSQNKHDVDVAIAYADVIQAYLKSGFLDRKSMKQYHVTYSEIVDQLITLEAATEQHFLNKINTALFLNNISDAQQIIHQFKETYPNSEQPYISAMAIYFDLRSFDQLVSELEKLKTSPITLSHHAMKVVRYWNEVIYNHEMVT